MVPGGRLKAGEKKEGFADRGPQGRGAGEGRRQEKQQKEMSAGSKLQS